MDPAAPPEGGRGSSDSAEIPLDAGSALLFGLASGDDSLSSGSTDSFVAFIGFLSC